MSRQATHANYRLDPQKGQADMYALSMQQKVTVVTALTEGNSIRSIERMTGIHRDTICRLLVSTGATCASLMNADEKSANEVLAD